MSESAEGPKIRLQGFHDGAREDTVYMGTVGKPRGFQAMLKDASLQEKKEHNGNILTIWVWDFYLFTFVIKQTQASNCLQMWLFTPGCLQICYMLKRFTGLYLMITYSVIKSCLVGMVVGSVRSGLCFSGTLCSSTQSFPHVYCSLV